jgi:large subunit ribosomal protein L18
LLAAVVDLAVDLAGALMSVTTQKLERRERRKARIRKRVYGTPELPRLTVFRSLKNIYAQLIDDAAGVTLVEASTRSKELQGELKYGGNRVAATLVGKLLGQRASAKGISRAAFDRNGYKFHGRVKALAEAARDAGLRVTGDSKPAEEQKPKGGKPGEGEKAAGGKAKGGKAKGGRKAAANKR